MTNTTYHALVTRETDEGMYSAVETRTIDMLPPGDVLVRVAYSSLNYKDALSANGNRGVTRVYPHIPGVDAAGEIVASDALHLPPSTPVIVAGYDLGMNTDGGFGQYIRVPEAWVLPLPQGLDPFAAMTIGTAGFTAALCLQRLEAAGLTPDAGEILVTGATGGVGMMAIILLSKLGYQCVAATGKLDKADLLGSIGATEVIDRDVIAEEEHKALRKQRWAGVVDTVGGAILAGAIKATRANGLVAACGNAASPELSLTVYPFILRGVSLLGVDAANCTLATRAKILGKLVGPWRFDGVERILSIIGLSELPERMAQMLRGEHIGRVVVDLWQEGK